MKKFTIIWVGKTNNKAIKNLIDDYKKRLSYSSKVDIIELKDEQSKEAEADQFLKKLPKQAHIFLLDELGKEFTSQKLSEHLENLTTKGKSHFVFLIGSAYGFSDKVREAANEQLALSKLTFTHEMIRPFILEQLYRCEQISKSSGYHH